MISFIGNYRQAKPNEKQSTSGRSLIKERYRLAKINNNYGLYGVRQFCNNDSPGDAPFEIVATFFKHKN